jgi:hypothetical protein
MAGRGRQMHSMDETQGSELFENVQFFQPSQKRVCRSMGLFVAFGALHFVQNLIALIDSRSSLLFSSKGLSVFKIADDTTILEMQFWRKMKIGRHSAENGRLG